MSKSILTQGECLKEMAEIPDNYVDMVLCDLPYGTTQNKWDTVIDLPLLWAAYKRICKPTAAIVLTASQPFTSTLVMSNPKGFRYQWVWDKVQATGHLLAKKAPMKQHEDVVVFGSAANYKPQMSEGHKEIKRTADKKGTIGGYNNFICNNPGKASSSLRYPKTIITFSQGRSPNNIPLHPTQKPVALMEYMIKTYTNEGMMVLGNCMGSGTTGVACMNLGRDFIGVEQDPEHFKTAEQRIKAAQKAGKA
jgi:DNA modification methylase